MGVTKKQGRVEKSKKPKWAVEKSTNGRWWVWSPREIKYLRRKHADSVLAKDIAAVLGRAPVSVRAKASTFGLSFTPKPKWAEKTGAGGWAWSDRESDYLRNKVADSVIAEDIAAVLGRTTIAICGRARSLGISLNVKRPHWTPEEDAFLRKNAGTLSVKELSDKLHHSPYAVRNRACKQLRVTLGAPCRVCGRKFRTAGKSDGNRWVCCKSCNSMYQIIMNTVAHHHHLIFKDKHPNYKGMPFFDGWNPDKGGSTAAGAVWIIKNLGPRPKGTTLHIIPQTMKGFVPGNLIWTSPRNQSIEQHYKIIGRQDHRMKELEIKEIQQRHRITEWSAAVAECLNTGNLKVLKKKARELDALSIEPVVTQLKLAA